MHSAGKTKQTSYGNSQSINSVQDVIKPEDGIDQTIKKIDEYLSKYGVSKTLVYDFDFKAHLAGGSSSVHYESQCRKLGLDQDELAEMVEQWKRHVPMKHPPICVIIDGKAQPASGNHRAYSKSKVGHKDRCILIGEELTDEEKRKLLKEVSSLSNTKHTNDKRTDTMQDVEHQVKNAWKAVKVVDVQGTQSLFAEDRHWKVLYDQCTTPTQEEALKREWFEHWMDEKKPNSFTSKSIRTRIFNGAMTDKSGQGGLPALTEAEIKTLYETAFPGYDWDPETYDFEQGSSIHQMTAQWGNRVENSPRNVRRTITDLILNGTYEQMSKVTPLHEVHLILTGDTGVTTIEGREKHIKEWIDVITELNQNPMRVDMKKVPLIGKVIIARALLGCGDKDRAYVINTQSKKFTLAWTGNQDGIAPTSSKRPRTEIVTVAEKRCCGCDEVKPADAFYTCRSKNIKDGLQPQCKDCAKAYEKRKRAAKKRAAS